jgi:alpha-methylacyl-CoA racemase
MIDMPMPDKSTMDGPLAGLKVLDFSTLLPGPYASLMLADLGADVVRIESPKRPDPIRRMPPTTHGQSGVHAWLNRNKRSLALDLKQPEGVEVVRRLVAEYDVVIEQFRPGVMARLGLGYEQLREARPGLIYCSITGFGQTGPWRDRAGHDINYMAVSGVASHVGEERPMALGVQVADIAGGSLHAAVAILAALAYRHRTGLGQHLDVSMTDAAFSLNAMSGAAYLAGGDLPACGTGRLNGGSFYGYYRTADGRYFSVGGLEPQFFAAFSEAMGHPEWGDLVTLKTAPATQRLKREIAAAFEQKDFEYWLTVFAAVDCCVEPVLTLEEAGRHPQVVAREMLVDVASHSGERYRQAAHPVRFSATPPAYRQAGAALGNDSEAVLAECGYSTGEVAALLAQGVTCRAAATDSATLT